MSQGPEPLSRLVAFLNRSAVIVSKIGRGSDQHGRFGVRSCSAISIAGLVLAFSSHFGLFRTRGRWWQGTRKGFALAISLDGLAHFLNAGLECLQCIEN